MEKKEYNQAISHLHLLIKLNSLSEEIHRQLMIAYAGLGNRSAIKDQYQSLTVILQNKLGLDPCPETRELFNRLYQIM